MAKVFSASDIASISPARPTQSRAGAASFGAPQGAALEGFGNVIDALGARIAKEDANKQGVEDSAFLDHVDMELDLGYQGIFDEEKGNITGGQPVTPAVRSRFEEATPEIVERVRAKYGYRPSEDALAKVERLSVKNQHSHLKRAAVYEHNERIRYLGERVIETTALIANKGAQSGDIEGALTRIDQSINDNAAVFGPDKVADVRQKAAETLLEQIRANQDPEAVAEMTRDYINRYRDRGDKKVEVEAGTGRAGMAAPTQSADDAAIAAISVRLETGKTDPLEGVSQVARDSGGSKSYGNFGLNSGGSAQRFAKEYGKPFGLTAEPGTAEFDAQWRNAAGAAPDELHAAEMDWYGKNILSDIKTKLKGTGLPDVVANDPRVKAYFADRSIQQGPSSIDGMKKHKARIKASYDAADGDVAAFLDNITEADRVAIGRDFPTALRTGVYSDSGHDTRLNGRLGMALAVGDRVAATQGEETLEGHFVRELIDKQGEIQRSVRSAYSALKEEMHQALDDDVRSIRETGVSTNPDLEKASKALTANRLKKHELDRQEAIMEFNALDGIEALPEQDLQERLNNLEPDPGETFYEMKAKSFAKAMTRADKIRDLRERDPASAVSSLPDVQVAEQGVRENPGDPQFVQALVKARMDAQAEVMPDSEGLWSPITKQESRVILAPTKGLEGNALYKSLEEVQAKFEEQYGPYARVAAAKAFEYDGRSKETAEELAGFVDGLFKGEKISASQIRRLEFLNETDLATRAFGGDFVGDPVRQYQGRPEGPETGMPLQVNPANAYRMRKPPKAAIDALQANPELRDQFDEFYGSGSAERVLVQ
jgi:hypothetical protein